MGHIHIDDHNMKLHVLIQPNIGWIVMFRHSIVAPNNILANEAVLTLKTRSAHWNASGSSFFELHILFNSQYEQLNDISNQIVERVRMLGGIAIAACKNLSITPGWKTGRDRTGRPAPFS